MFKKVLIANRGEIACRLIRACQQLNIRTVAVYSIADQDAQFVQMADEAYCIGAAPATESYLNREAILMAGVVANVDAIHPGYGFLSEDALFVQMCSQCGIQWLGPRAEIISLMGDKSAARRFAASRGIAIIPGTMVLDDEQELHAQAVKLGFPLLVKASHGGGGKGIKLVNSEAELTARLRIARQESQTSFANMEIYLEKMLPAARHIEIQVIGDQQGHIQILGDRDCTLQLGRQKVIEESPACYINDAQRHELAVMVHHLLDDICYQGLGTVEFLFCEDRFYFLEMNTRLQVEHGVTEQTSGLDIVLLQLQLAAGTGQVANQPISVNGTAIECRVTFKATGPDTELTRFDFPRGVRVETGYQVGDQITPYYDSLLAKVIVHGANRADAVQQMQFALEATRIEGVDTNLVELKTIVTSDEYIQNQFTVETLDAGMKQRNESFTS